MTQHHLDRPAQKTKVSGNNLFLELVDKEIWSIGNCCERMFKSCIIPWHIIIFLRWFLKGILVLKILCCCASRRTVSCLHLVGTSTPKDINKNDRWHVDPDNREGVDLLGSMGHIDTKLYNKLFIANEHALIIHLFLFYVILSNNFL